MATDLVTSRHMVRRAAILLDHHSHDVTVAIAMAKLIATEKCFQVRIQ
jgi:alkylation response protein AidB-like acyl-CoA dehydrogenase